MRTSIKLTLWSILFWSCCTGAATVVTRTIREDGSGNYTNLLQWEAARERDLVAADEIEVAVIEGTWTNPETTGFSIAGWTTDATHYIVITNSTSKHSGKWTSTAYRLETTTAPINIFEDFVKVYGVQFKLTASSGGPAMVNFGVASGSRVLFQDCIFRGDVTGTGDSDYFYHTTSGALAELINCVAYNSTNSKCRFAIGRINAYNCTVANMNRGFYYADNATNCIVQDCGTAAFEGTGGNYNCSDDATAPGASSVLSYEVPFVSETLGSEDYHITSAATSVIGAGLDNASSVSTDIDGQTRSDWDIGADEYVSTVNGQVIIVVTQ